MDAIDYWKLCGRVTLFQAIVLITGFDPESHTSGDIVRQGWDNEVIFPEPAGYGAVRTALHVAAQNGWIDVEIRELVEHDQNGNEVGPIPDTIDIVCNLCKHRVYPKISQRTQFPF
jgi:hypothetical protein